LSRLSIFSPDTEEVRIYILTPYSLRTVARRCDLGTNIVVSIFLPDTGARCHDLGRYRLTDRSQGSIISYTAVLRGSLVLHHGSFKRRRRRRINRWVTRWDGRRRISRSLSGQVCPLFLGAVLLWRPFAALRRLPPRHCRHPFAITFKSVVAAPLTMGPSSYE
jgi:hypothetical protein